MRKILPAVTLIGITSFIAQVVLIRELLITFFGNELSLGIILAAWLFLTAIGSMAFKRLSSKLKNLNTTLVSLLILLSLALPAQILIARSMKNILGTIAGEIISFPAMAIYSCLTLAPACLIIGFLFALASEIYSKGQKEKTKSITKVYIADAIGDTTAGILFTFLLIYFYPAYVFFALSILCLTAAFFLCEKKKSLLLVFLALSLAINIYAVTELRDYSLEHRWGNNLVSSENSKYGNLVVTKSENQYNFYENGIFMFSSLKTVEDEELAHLALLSHAAPRDILLIGNPNLIEEILKHDVNVDYFELDPLIISTIENLALGDVFENKKVNIHYGDARHLLKKSQKKYDIILVDLPEPGTTLLNRFYTKEFFREAKSRLNQKGILVTTLPSSETYMAKEMLNINTCIFKTLKSVFSSVNILPANIFLASDSQIDLDKMTERFDKRKIESDFVGPELIDYRLYQRTELNYEQKFAKTTTSLNTDFQPVSYFYDMILLSTLSSSGLESILYTLYDFSLPLALVLIILPALFLRQRKTYSVLPTVLIVGFTGISIEIILSLAFQAIYGYLYYEIGILLMLFMLGLASGSLCALKLFIKENIIGALKRAQITLIATTLLIPFFLLNISHIPDLLVHLFIYLFMLLAGSLVGAVFPLASKIYLKREKSAGKAAGAIYSRDLLGACCGALLITIIFLPLLGILKTCLLIAGLNLAVLVGSRHQK